LPDEKQKCFVLMPFEAPRDKYYAQIYSRAIDDAGMAPKRGDSLFRPSPIMGDIWKFVQESTVLLADLTGRNANVFYELGLAHAIEKPVVLVAETMDDVPFDLRGLRVLTFDRHDPEWGAQLRGNIAAALKETLADVRGAVPPMFIRTIPRTPATATEPETTLELRIRELAEEITALRRETNRDLKIDRAPRDGEVAIDAVFVVLDPREIPTELAANTISMLSGRKVVRVIERHDSLLFELETSIPMDDGARDQFKKDILTAFNATEVRIRSRPN
jgi:hypothetical protein